MTGMMTEGRRGRARGKSVGGRPLWRTLKGGLTDVYMFILQVSRSRSLCALTGSRQNAFIGASRGSPWESTVCQHRETPHCQAYTSPPKAQEESNSHTSRASHTGLGTGRTLEAQHCPKKEKLSQICFHWEEHLIVSSLGKKDCVCLSDTTSHVPWLSFYPK